MKKQSFWLAVVFAFVLLGCGSGDGNSSPSSQPENRSTVSGYVEDDPIVDAIVIIKNADGEEISTSTTDANGLYSLEGIFTEGETYSVNTKGRLGDKVVEMNSMFVFNGDASDIHVNPLTELKHQLMQDGKSASQAESLIREYFSIANGESLENNRFVTSDTAYIGMKGVAELYEGTLPIDAISKIKEDILANADLSVKDYSFRTLVKKEIKLEATTTSAALGEIVTISVSGVDTLNENFTLVWSGIPEDANGTGTSKTFTISDNAQDVFVSVTLNKVDANITTLISSASTKINFYKELEVTNITIEDVSIDNNVTAGNNLNISIPAGTLSDGETIAVTELETNSDTSLAQFSLDAGSATDGNITFNYSYDPYMVSEPRNLQITLHNGDEIQILSVSDIDYINHVVSFEILLAGTISRANNDILLYIQQTISKPTEEDITNLLDKLRTEYRPYLYKVLNKFYPNSKDYIYELLTEYESNPIQRSKIYKVLTTKYEGAYKYNILVSVINSIIAEENAEDFFQDSDETWEHARDSFDLYMEAGCFQMIKDPSGNYVEARLDYPFVSNENHFLCEVYKDGFKNKILDLDALLSKFLGNSRLTDNQTNYYKNLKLIYNIGEAAATASVGGTPNTRAKLFDYLSKLGGAGIDYYWPADMHSEAAGNTFGVVSASIVSAVDESGDFSIKSQALATGQMILVNEFFKYLENLTIENNIIKTSPILLALSENYSELRVDENFNSRAFFKQDFFPTFFSEYYSMDIEQLQSNCINSGHVESCTELQEVSIYTYMWEDNDYFHDKKPWQFGELIDANNRLSGLLLEETSISNKERAQAFFFLRYAFGDEQAKKQINNYTEGMYSLGWMILSDMVFMADSEVVYENSLVNINSGDLASTDIIADYRVEISNFSQWKAFLFRDMLRSNTSETRSNIKNIGSFQTLMETAKLKLSNAQLEALNIKKIKVEAYGVGLEYSSSDNAWTLNDSDKVNHTYLATQNINDQFTYDSVSEKNVLSLATLFASEDFTQFDNKLVGLKITLVFEKNGRDKVLSSDFVFTTLADTENLTDTNFSGATLKSSVRDAVSGDPVVGAFVTLNPGGLSSLTDANGNYEVSNLAAGEYTIIISKSGYGQIEASLTLEEDEVKLYEASLSIDDEHATTMGTTSITIKDAFNGTTITDGYIKVRAGQNNTNGDVVESIESDGNTSIDLSLFPGVYTVEAGANGYSKSFATITIIGDTAGHQEISISTILSSDQARIVLSWGESPRDLDSHLVKKVNDEEVYHIFYGNRNPSSADANLDTDDTSSYGPETVTINGTDSDAVYTYYVHNYSGGSDDILPNSGAKVDVYIGDSLRTFYIPNESGKYWKVFEIVNGSVVPCTTNCVQDSTTTLVRTLSGDAHLFENLPAK